MQRSSWRNFDPFLAVFAAILVGYGLTVLWSATRADGVAFSASFWRQAAMAVIGIALMVGISLIDYRIVGQFAPFLYVGMIAILLVVLAVGTLVSGAQRWLEIGGIRLQPSEPAKLIAVVVLARFFAGRAGEASTTGTTDPLPSVTAGTSARTNFLALGIIAPVFALVYLQPDLGTALVVIVAYFSVAYVAGVPHAILAGLASVPLLGFPVVWSAMRPYMRNRITTFLAPDRDPLGEGYNLIQARISVGSGGWTGRGLGNGTQTQLNFLRVQHTDFIFAVIGEELGFVGGVGLIVLYGLLIWRCLRALARSRDAFGRYLVGGITGTMLFQAFVNIAMNVGLLPVTGIPLPFISFGGSSLLTLFASLGIVQSVLVHSQARRYDSRPSVGVPARTRLKAGRFALAEIGPADPGPAYNDTPGRASSWDRANSFDVPDPPPRPRRSRASEEDETGETTGSPPWGGRARGERLRWRAEDGADAPRQEPDGADRRGATAPRPAEADDRDERAALRLRRNR